MKTPFRNPPRKTYPKSKDLPYKKNQRELKEKLRRANILWVSCRVVETPLGRYYQQVQGTYNKTLHGPIGANGARREMLLKREGRSRKSMSRMARA